MDRRELARIAVMVFGGLVLFYVFGWISILATAAIAFFIFRKQKMSALQNTGITVGIITLLALTLGGYWIWS